MARDKRLPSRTTMNTIVALLPAFLMACWTLRGTDGDLEAEEEVAMADRGPHVDLHELTT